MNIIFLTLARINSIGEKSIYTDLLRKFRIEGHNITVIAPNERRFKKKTSLIKDNDCKILQVWTPNIQKTNILEKAIGIITINYFFKMAYKKFLIKENFDLILYSTPPITFTNLIKTIKDNTNARTYLLLKDIFPQNAVDLGFFSKNNLIYKYLRKKEIQLYKISDWIGCMSEANKSYILKNNLYLSRLKVEVNPNSIYLQNYNMQNTNSTIDLPENKTIFVYGGNLGKPQGLKFLLDVIINNINNSKAYFIIVGSGTESARIKKWFGINKPDNAKFIPELPQEDYKLLLKKCHVGLVFLNPNFTIPNYPSRILHYMENKLPILFAIDKITDVGSEAELHNYGLWCENGDIANFRKFIDFFINEDHKRISMGNNGFNRLQADFSVDFSYKVIMKHFEKNILMN
jgi:glycosyltransferase involved in cell wall biosynthesis